MVLTSTELVQVLVDSSVVKRRKLARWIHVHKEFNRRGFCFQKKEEVGRGIDSSEVRDGSDFGESVETP